MADVKLIRVRYMHPRRPRFVDSIYGTGLTWTQGQVHPLPVSVALKLLRHEDMFEDADKPAKRVVHAAKASDAEATQAENVAQAAVDEAKRLIAIATEKRAQAKAAAEAEAKATTEAAAAEQAKAEADKLAKEQQTDEAKQAEAAAQAQAKAKQQQAEKEAQAEKQRQQDHQELQDQLDRCATKQSLVDFAQTRFQVKLDGKKDLADLRAQTKTLVDRFGAP